MKHTYSLTAAVVLLTVLCACGTDTTAATDTTADTVALEAATETTASEPEYHYPALDMGGETFTILNADMTGWQFYSYLDFEEQTGEVLDDAVFLRNRNMEERYNFTLEDIEGSVDTNFNDYRIAITAGDDAYDVCFARCDRFGSFVTDNMVFNLLDYPEYQLDQPWWDYLVNEKSRLGDGNAQYFAANDITLSGLEGTLCVYFNETMMNNLDITRPYQLVRDGKWTMDAMFALYKQGVNLNGDQNFTWSANGNAVYGIITFEDAINGFLTGTGLAYIEVEDGQPALVSDNEQFYDMFSKLHDFTSVDGNFLHLNDADNDHYEMAFKNNRCLFTIAEIKASAKYRDMDETFGIVPMPKYDEAQTQYYSHRTHVCPTMTVPVTNPDPAKTGIILDALAYESYRDLLPIYYDIRVSQKGLRNEESIEMLSIIRNTRSFDIGEGYGWTEDLAAAINTMYATTKQNNIASRLDAMRPAIEKKIVKTMEYLNG